MIDEQVIPYCRRTNLSDSLSEVAAELHGHSLPFTESVGLVTAGERGEAWLRERLGAKAAFLVPSGTAALDLSALLAKMDGDSHFLVSSFTFPSTASAFMLRGAKPVFVDIRPDTLCMDEKLAEAAVDSKVKAIVVTHYGGVGAEMDALTRLAEKHGLVLIEDAAHSFLAKYRGRYLGSIGHLGVLSFHHTKNIQCGEGGALLVNDSSFIEAAEMLRDKGTNRSRFLRGEISEYAWVDIGGNFHLADILSAYLLPQFLAAEEITRQRMAIWQFYHQELKALENRGDIRLPNPPEWCEHNAHIYHLRTDSRRTRTSLMHFLKGRGVFAVTHYAPLHSSPLGQQHNWARAELPETQRTAETLLRLPLYYGLTQQSAEKVTTAMKEFYGI